MYCKKGGQHGIKALLSGIIPSGCFNQAFKVVFEKFLMTQSANPDFY
jgi:hypothetical protein